MVSCVLDGWIGTGDPTHSEKLVDELNFGVSKGAAAPGTKATATSDPHSGHTLTSQRAEKYRSLAGRELHHSLDVPLVKFDTGLVMRGMDTPRVLEEVATPSVRCIAEHSVWTGCFDGRESAKR